MVFNPVVSGMDGRGFETVNFRIWFDSVGLSSIKALLPDGTYSSLSLESTKFIDYEVVRYGLVTINLGSGSQCNVSGDFYGNGTLSDGGNTFIVPTGDIQFVQSVS